MRKWFETWAAAAAMAEGGDSETAQALCRELEELEKRGRPRVVIVLAAALTPESGHRLESLLERFPADVLLTTTADAQEMDVGLLRQFLARRHFVSRVHLGSSPRRILDSLLRRLGKIQFVICIGDKAALCPRKGGVPVFAL